MKKLPFVSLVATLAVAACGGSVAVDPITRVGEAPAPADPEKKTEATPEPVAPTAPYDGDVGTNDVSVLYPMPLFGESQDFLRPSEASTHGALLPQTAFAVAVPKGKLETTDTTFPSGYYQLGLVSFRLDHCSARKGPGTCTSEVRGVFQAIYTNTETMPDGDTTHGAAAMDGALHVIWEVPEAELVIMMKQLLTLRTAHGTVTTTRLEPHPILVQQGLGGGFAQGLRSILLEHVGADRIARVTVFDHNMAFDSDGWIFETFDRSGDTLVRGKIPTRSEQSIFVVGTNAFAGPIGMTSTFEADTNVKDSVAPLVNSQRPEKGTPEVTSVLQPAFENAIKVQNPTLHNAETTDCANCHLAEGAHLIAENVYALKATSEFTAPGGTSYLLDRSSVTNLHAFGYLHRKVSIMQRTANESTVVRDWMDKKVK